MPGLLLRTDKKDEVRGRPRFTRVNLDLHTGAAGGISGKRGHPKGGDEAKDRRGETIRHGERLWLRNRSEFDWRWNWLIIPISW